MFQRKRGKKGVPFLRVQIKTILSTAIALLAGFNILVLQRATKSATPLTHTRPLLILHVGPPKTGTTSLQHSLNLFQSELLQDGYYYMGNSSTVQDFSRCMNRLKNPKSKGTECWYDFAGTLERHRRLGHNVIASNEVISLHAQLNELFWKLLQDALRAWLPHVLVVVSYRHLHNFLPSTHFELQKNQRWPSAREKGKFVTPFVKFWKTKYNRDLQMSGPIPTPAAVLSRFRNSSYDVSILDIENKEQISEFFCAILTNAPTACRALRNQTSAPQLNRNDGGQVNYDALALLAWQREFLKRDQTRRYLRNKIKDFNEKTMKRTPTHFPLECMTDLQEAMLWNESVVHAQQVGLPLDANMLKAMRQDFDRTKSKKKLCTINATAALEMPEWLDFFSKAKTKW
jgi:hypothetical protein